MEKIQNIKGDLIQDLYTKFFYVGKKLCYQIIVNYVEGIVYYKDFNDYEAYRISHNRLIKAINNKKEIKTELSVLQSN